MVVENIDFRIRGFVDQFESAMDSAIGKIDEVSSATRRANKLLNQGFSEDSVRGLVSGLTSTAEQANKATRNAAQFKRNVESAFRQIASGNNSLAQIATRVGGSGLKVLDVRSVEFAVEQSSRLIENLRGFAEAGLGAEKIREELERAGISGAALDAALRQASQNSSSITLEKFVKTAKEASFTVNNILSQLSSANLSLFNRLENVLPGLRGQAAGNILEKVGLTGKNLKSFTNEVVAVEKRTEQFLNSIREVGEVTQAEFTKGISGPKDLRINIEALERATKQAREELSRLAKQNNIDINVNSLGAADVRRARGALENLDNTSTAFKRGFEEKFGSAARVANRNSNRMEQAFDGAALSLFFFGLQLRSVSRTISRTAITTYNDVISRTSESATAVDRLNGAFQFLQFAVGQALLPVIQFLTPIILSVAEWTMENEDLVASLVVIAGVAGVLLTVVSSLRLAFLSAGEVAGRFASGAADSAGFFAGSVVPKFKKGTDRYKKNVNGFRKSGEKNLSSLQRAFRRFGDEGVLLADTTGSFFGDIRKSGRGAFGRLKDSIFSFSRTARDSISSFIKNGLNKFGGALTSFSKNPLTSLRSGLGGLASFLTGGLKAAFSAVFSPAGIIVVVIAAVVALAAALSQNQELLDSLKKNILGPIQRAFSRLKEAFGFGTEGGSGFKDVLNVVLSVLTVVGGVIAAVAGILVTIFVENLIMAATVIDIALIQPLLVVIDVIRAVIAALSGDFSRAGDLIFGVGNRIKGVFSDVAAIPGQIGESFLNIKDSVTGGFSFITDTVSTLQEEGGFLGLFEGDSTTSSEANIDVQTKGSQRQVQEQRKQQDLQRETNREVRGVKKEIQKMNSRRGRSTNTTDSFGVAIAEADRVA